MPSRAWVATIALGLSLSLTSAPLAQDARNTTLESEPVPAPRQEQGRPTSQQDAKPENERSPALVTAVERIEAAIRELIPTKDEKENARQEQREIGDLRAQQDMALWAERMFWAALASVLLTTVGVFLIWRTLHHTKLAAIAARDAVKEGREAATAANAAVEQAADRAKRELRAYLSAVPIGVNQLIRSEEGMGHVALRNVGKLPARNVTLMVHMQMTNTRDFPVNAIGGFKNLSQRVIQPGAEIRQGSEERIPVRDICRADQYVFVWGIAFYDDGYGEQRFTRFCHRYATSSYNRAIGGKPIDWNNSRAFETRSIIDAGKARYHEHGNDAD